MVKSIESICNKFLEDGYPYYIVSSSYGENCVNKKVSDIEEATERLRGELNDLEEIDNGLKYLFYTFSEVPTKNWKVKKEWDTYYGFNFPKKTQIEAERSSGKDRYYESKNAEHSLIREMLAEVKKDNEKLREKIEVLENSEPDEVIEQSAQSNILGAVLNNPQIQAVLAGVLTNIVGNTFNQPKPQAMAGIPQINQTEEQKIAQALEILLKHNDRLGDDLLLLADMADNNTFQFNMLLKMLRK